MNVSDTFVTGTLRIKVETGVLQKKVNQKMYQTLLEDIQI